MDKFSPEYRIFYIGRDLLFAYAEPSKKVIPWLDQRFIEILKENFCAGSFM